MLENSCITQSAPAMLYSSAKPQYMSSKISHSELYKTAWHPPVLPLCVLQGARTLVDTGMPLEKGTSMAIRGAESPSDNPKYINHEITMAIPCPSVQMASLMTL